MKECGYDVMQSIGIDVVKINQYIERSFVGE